MTCDFEIMVRDEIRNAFPDQFLKIMDMVREHTHAVRDLANTNLKELSERVFERFNSVDETIFANE
jgi:hypothetical protein